MASAAYFAPTRDTRFLEHALTRFSGVAAASRRARGSVDWTLLLDPAKDVLHDHVPGLLQLRPKAKHLRQDQFTRMHAKVALLGFGPARAGSPSKFRVIVSTGNWTYESASQLIEMVWHIDVDAEASRGAEDDRIELWAAASFLKRLFGSYQAGGDLTYKAQELLADAMKAARDPSETVGIGS